MLKALEAGGMPAIQAAHRLVSLAALLLLMICNVLVQGQQLLHNGLRLAAEAWGIAVPLCRGPPSQGLLKVIQLAVQQGSQLLLHHHRLCTMAITQSVILSLLAYYYNKLQGCNSRHPAMSGNACNVAI